MKLINKSAAKLAVLALAVGAISACSTPREKVVTYQCEAGKSVTVSYLPYINNNGSAAKLDQDNIKNHNAMMPLILLHMDGQKIQMHNEGVSSIDTYATVHKSMKSDMKMSKDNWSDWNWRNEARVTSGASYINDANNLRIRSQVGGIGSEATVDGGQKAFYLEKLNTARSPITTSKGNAVAGTGINGGVWEIQARACK